MALIIRTTGLEQYAPGGEARIKVLNIGGPGVGKTRWASYFPAPIYADCEGGLASVADRKVPFVPVNTSDDMLDLLTFLKQECRQPADRRTYQTVVIDTLDAFQRKVKNEWMEKEKKEAFSGWDAWGFLNSKMQLLMTRLLNLPMNVIVNVHYKDKKTDDESGATVHSYMLQLQGELTETAFNDFDLVGWTGTYWEAVDGERQQKRGITFKPTPEKPFLKDRLHVTPDWLPIAFDTSDYTNLFDAVTSRLGDITAGEIVGEVPDAEPELTAFSTWVIPPGAAGSGPMPATTPRDIPFGQLDKPALLKKTRDLGITTTIDGTPIKANTLKGELIAALEAHQNTPAPTPPPPAPTQVVPEGIVNTETGELRDPQAAVDVVSSLLGGVVLGTVVTDPPPPTTPVIAAVPAPEPSLELTCDVCEKGLADQNPDIVKLSYIRFRKRLCDDCYATAKAAR